MSMQSILDAVLGGAQSRELERMSVPGSYRAAVVRRDEVPAFAALPAAERDPAVTLHVDEVPTPELAPDEALVAVLASSINYNTVWSSIFEPAPTFAFLDRLGRQDGWGRRHALPYHALGTDAAGVVLRVGSLVRRWRPGDRVTVHAAYADSEDPEGHDDAMLGENLRAWGYETNFGGLGELAVAKASQLLAMPDHLTWEEAAVNGACNSTSYRMVVSPRGAPVRRGNVVLVWGAAGGLGSYVVQHVHGAGGLPVCVTSSARRVDLLHRLGCEAVIDRAEAGYRFWSDPHTQDPAEWRRLGRDIRALVGQDPDIVVEHPGRETMGASVFVVRRGGTVVTCAATTGAAIEYDQRHLWMKLKTIRGTHIANYAEGNRANELVRRGLVQPAMSAVYPLDQVGEAAARVHRNEHVGKVAVLCLAPKEGLGVADPDLRRAVGPHRITAFRAAAEATC